MIEDISDDCDYRFPGLVGVACLGVERVRGVFNQIVIRLNDKSRFVP